jgi:hypothetical protein
VCHKEPLGGDAFLRGVVTEEGGGELAEEEEEEEHMRVCNLNRFQYLGQLKARYTSSLRPHTLVA